jgi:hypothetical protein
MERDSCHLFITKEARCIFDTGNLQGNIVSKDFLLNTLKYTARDFKALTEKEKLGGIGANGGKIIPEGAVYLTWYHASSTKVFRNMRFLVSPCTNFDLVIGARSIKTNDLLIEPNFFIGTGKDKRTKADRDRQSQRILNKEEEARRLRQQKSAKKSNKNTQNSSVLPPPYSQGPNNDAAVLEKSKAQNVHEHTQDPHYFIARPTPHLQPGHDGGHTNLTSEHH